MLGSLGGCFLIGWLEGRTRSGKKQDARRTISRAVRCVPPPAAAMNSKKGPFKLPSKGEAKEEEDEAEKTKRVRHPNPADFIPLADDVTSVWLASASLVAGGAPAMGHGCGYRAATLVRVGTPPARVAERNRPAPGPGPALRQKQPWGPRSELCEAMFCDACVLKCFRPSCRVCRRLR